MLVFGGTGDLALHKLLPALYHLHRDGRLPADMRILAAARNVLNRAEYQRAAHHQGPPFETTLGPPRAGRSGDEDGQGGQGGAGERRGRCL